MDPAYLGMLTSIGVNKKVYQPSGKEIKDKYHELFRGKGGWAGATEAGASEACPSTPGPSNAPGLSSA